MLEWIRSNPEIVTGIVGGLLALLLGGTERFWAYLKTLAGEHGAKNIMAQAIESAGEVGDARVQTSEGASPAEKAAALAFKEAVDLVKAKVRISTAMAPEPTHKAVGNAVATADKKKITPLKVLGFLGRAGLWAVKRAAGL